MARSGFWHQTFLKSIGFLFIVLFTYAATSKLIGFGDFKSQLAKSPFISGYANWIAWCVPFLEYAIVGLFLFPKYGRIALFASGALMGLFTLYILLVLNFSDSIPCGCGGVLSNLGWKSHLVFNICFVLLAILGVIMKNKKSKI
jgi:hypothetical protein